MCNRRNSYLVLSLFLIVLLMISHLIQNNFFFCFQQFLERLKTFDPQNSPTQNGKASIQELK